MFKFILTTLLLVLFGTNLYSNDNTPRYNQKAQTILETISNLEKSGYITSKNAIDAKKQFVFNNPDLLEKTNQSKEKTVSNHINWTEYLSLINIMKLLAIIFLLIAFRGLIVKFIVLFTLIPIFVYQALILSLSIILTFYSNFIWLSEAKYLSIFGVISNIFIIAWIISTYEDFFIKLYKYISLNIPADIVMSLYSTLYFGLFAIYLDSSFLGIIATISFVSMFSFTIESTGLSTLIGYDKEDYVNQSLLVSLLIVVTYSFVTISGIHLKYLDVFSLGIEYVLTTVLVITLLIKTSFAFQEDKMFAFNILIFVLLFLGSIVSSILFHLDVIPSIINTGFLIFILGWLHYFVFKINGILTMFLASVTLYMSALFLEKYPEYFVTNLF